MPLHLTPEMTGEPYRATPNGYITNCATTASDGMANMPDDTLVNFHTRSLLQLSMWVLRQLPASLDIQVDANKFISAFKYRDGNNYVEAALW
jgi:hypothetical protein